MKNLKAFLYSSVSFFQLTLDKCEKSIIKKVLGILLISSSLLYSQPVLAQLNPSLSFGHETWPSMSVSNLEVDGSYSRSLNDLRVWTDTRFVRGSYPILL